MPCTPRATPLLAQGCTAPALPPEAERPGAGPHPFSSGDVLKYWLGMPLRWAWQVAHNGLGIVRVLDITRVRPMPAGLISQDHPWATGINPETGKPVWHQNVLYRSARGDSDADLPPDEEVVTKTCRFLAEKAALSAVVPETPQGPGRRMPHGINYIHGSCHYNSGIFVFTDFADALAHFTERRFRAEVWRFVRQERREVLILFRERHYTPREIGRAHV